MADVALNFTGKVFGVNLTSKPGSPLESAYWTEWDWEGWIRKQIDYAVSMGANVIRLIGDIVMVDSGAITQALYNKRLQQLVAYCVLLGVAVYYTGCATYGTDGVSNGTSSRSAATISAILNSNIGAITGVSGAPDYTTSIICCDLIQEADALADATKVNAVYTAVKPNVPAIIPVTFSTVSTLASTTWLNSIINSCDLLDYHIYPQVYGDDTPPTTTDVTNGPRVSYSTKEILFGEGGCGVGKYNDNSAHSAGSVTVSTWYSRLASMGMMSDSKVRGAMMWAAQDQGTVDGQKYGAFDSTWTPRSYVLLPWVKGSASSVGPAAPAIPQITHDGLVLVSPRGCSTDYSGVKIYRDGSLIATVSHGLYDDSANVIPGTQYSYTAKVTTASNGDSAASTALSWHIPTSRR